MYAHTCRAARECIVYNKRMLGDAYVGRTGRARYMVCVEKAGSGGWLPESCVCCCREDMHSTKFEVASVGVFPGT